MAGYSPRSDQLWYFAQQLVEEETKSILLQQQEEHGQRIKTKYSQLVSNLSCLGDIIVNLYQKEKLTFKEFEHIHHLQPTPIRANEELLNIIARKPRDVFDCFMSIIKDMKQMHLYQMLVSDDGPCDKAEKEDASYHRDLIRRNFIWLSEKLDPENGFISLLYQKYVLTAREKELIYSMNNTFLKNESLLGLLSKKSPKDFETFLEALESSAQGHLAMKFRNPDASSGDTEGVSSAGPTLISICHERLPKEVLKSRQKPVSKPLPPPKSLSKSAEKVIPSRSVSKPTPPPKPGTRSTSGQYYTKSLYTVAKTSEKAVYFRKAEDAKFQARLTGLECRLQTEIAIKVICMSLVCLHKAGDCLKMWFQTLLQECHQMRKEIVTRTDETNMELQQLRMQNSKQFSVATTLKEVLRAQLNSVQQELTNERLQIKKERLQFEEKINKFKTDIYTEKAKCKRFEEEKLHSNTLIVEMDDRLKRADCDRQCFIQQIHELNNRLTTTEHELHRFKQFEEDFTVTISLRTERDKLKEECEILRKENEIRNDLEVSLLKEQKTSQELQTKLNEKDRSLKLAVKEELDLIKSQTGAAKDELLRLNTDFILKLQAEVDNEKHLRHGLEDKLLKLEERDLSFFTKESHVIRNNHQFLVENMKSHRLIDLLHKNNFITDDERYHLNAEPLRYYRNDDLLQLMRTISLKQDRWPLFLECLRQDKQHFIVQLLEKGGVLIKSKISTKLVKNRLFTKSPTKNVEDLKEKQAMVIEGLNYQLQGLSLYDSLSATSEITDGDIVISPYCHQEFDGIVIWFWCQLKNGENKLRYLCKSGFLLELLITIFKKYSIDFEPSASISHIPTGVTIFESDFKDTFIIHYEKSKELTVNKSIQMHLEAQTEPFDDGKLVPDGKLIFVTGMKFNIRTWNSDTIVEGIEVFYNIGKSVLHGIAGSGFVDDEFHLGLGERIISVKSRARCMIDQLQFTTNRGNVIGPFGGNGDSVHVLMMSDHSNTNAYLAYITGTVDVIQKRTAIRRLRFVWGFYKRSS